MRAEIHNVGGWVARWARRRGAALAVVDDQRRLDYRGLEERTAQMAGWLRAAGVGPGDRIAVVLGNRSAYFEALMGAARIGAIGLPVNTRLSPREIRYLLEDCRPAAVLFEHELSETVEKACAPLAHPPALQIAVGGEPDAYEAGLAAAEPRAEIHPVSPDDPMMLMYTSGTTGAPKGALLPHRKTLYNSLNAQLFFGIRAADRVLVVAPLFHSLGLQILSLPMLYSGGTLVLQRRFDPSECWRAIEREGVTYIGGVPTMYQRLLDELEAGALPGLDLSTLRFLFTAGAAIPVDLIHAYQARGLVLKQGYGQTETSILCCLDSADAVRKAGSVGRPVFHADVRVVRLDDLDGAPEGWRDTPEDATGEIVVRGPINMLGYWERPEATAETLRGEWLRTGDLARRDAEGFITLTGRAREMYISGGENVYPAEVEAALSEHPDIREVAVVGVPDSRWGEVGRAHLVLQKGRSLDEPALLTWARERLARFKIPARFLQEEALPRTESGKVQKHRLEDRDGAAG